MRKNILVLCTGVMFFIGLFFAFTPFIHSWSPSQKAKADRSQHDISKLSAGEYIFEPLNRENAWNEKVLIIKDWDNNIYSYLVPTENNLVPMPEKWWGWGYYKCKDFRPQTDEDNKLIKNGKIKCHDQDLSESQNAQWQWSYTGKANIRWITDMYSIKNEITDNFLYINR